MALVLHNKIPFFLSILKHATILHPVVRTFYDNRPVGLNLRLMGLPFSHPIGVASGFDKRGEFTDAMACYSPSFIEIGPLHDVRLTIRNLQDRKAKDTLVFGNLSNSKDLVSAFTLLYDFVDAIVFNVSHGSSVSKVIDHLLELRRYNDTNKPILFKLFPDLMNEELDQVASYMLESGIDGVIVSAEFVDRIREKTLGLLPIIAMAEISKPERAAQLLDTGADLIAVTNSPFHYGPRLIYKIVKYLDKR